MLSRVFYLIVAAIAAAGIAAAYIATAEINESAEHRVEEQILRDRTELELWLRHDARVRLDTVAPMAAHEDVRGALRRASGLRAGQSITEIRSELAAKLAQLNGQLEEGAAQLLFAVDKHGVIIAQLGGTTPPQGAGLSQFPVVARALRGFEGDDVWVYNNAVYRIAARPVVDGGQFVGAIIHGTDVNRTLASRLASRIPGATVGFFWREQMIGTHAANVQNAPDEGACASQLSAALAEGAMSEGGRTEVLSLGETGLGVYSRVTGSAAYTDVGYVVARPRSEVNSPMDLFKSDGLAAVNWPLVIGVALGLGILGWLLIFFEFSVPFKRFRLAAEGLQSANEMEESSLARRYRPIASQINDALRRVAGTGTKKAQNMDEILGESKPSGGNAFFGFEEKPGAEASLFDPPPAPRATPTPPLSSAATPPLSAAAGKPAAAPPRRPPPPPVTPQLPEMSSFDEEEGLTAISQVPEELIAATAASTEERHFLQVYEEYVAMKKQCGETVAGLTFEKFRATLEKNKESIRKTHGVSSVRFTVYKKDGKAKLKATPVK